MRGVQSLRNVLARVIGASGEATATPWNISPRISQTMFDMCCESNSNNIRNMSSNNTMSGKSVGPGVGSVDIFTKKLQQKTERELETIMEKHSRLVNDQIDDDLANMHKEAQGQEEIGGPKGPEPTRYGDWERAGRCSDF